MAMRVSEEWRGHAHGLRRIVEMIQRRPTTNARDQSETLLRIADVIEADAAIYEADVGGASKTGGAS